MAEKLKEKKFEGKGALWPFLREIFRYSLRYRRWFVPMGLAATGVALVDALFPYLWSRYLDDAVTPLVERGKSGAAGSPDFTPVLLFGLAYLLFMIIQWGGTTVFMWYTGKIRNTVIHDLRRDLFEKLQRLSFSFYDRSAIGWLISRVTNDSERVTEVVSWGMMDVIWGLMMILACFGVMAYYNWQLMLIVLASIPLLLMLSVGMRRRILQYSRESRRVNSEMIAYFNEHVHGIAVNKVSAQEETAAGGFSEMSEDMKRVSYRAHAYSALLSPLVIIIGSATAGLIIYAGGQQVLSGAGLTVGMLVAFFTYATLIYGPIHNITNFYATAQGAVSAGERIFSLLREPLAIRDAPGMPDFGDIRGDITFERVTFHYVKDQVVLEDFHLHIRAGESIALVGPTGEGKTTIASLVARFYEPKTGRVLIDGVDYRERTLASLRRQLGIILQTPHVFSGTVLENIRYGDFDATEAEVIATLQMIGAEELAPRLNEPVGEGGGNLSAGEKQLISFARVIVKNPKILIMDEATSSVDTLAEAKIQRGIEKLIRGRTAIIIAHRLSTIRNCDRILVIRQGQIIEEGSHQQLLERQGYYWQLYTRQTREGMTS